MAQIAHLFDQLLAAGGSDLHLGITYPPMMRARGDLVAMRETALDAREMQSLLFEIATPEQQKTILEGLDPTKTRRGFAPITFTRSLASQRSFARFRPRC
jgi:Tfp pilus assembly pilus retraction ATPase PilT